MIKDRRVFINSITALMVNFNFQPNGGDEGVKKFVDNLYNILSETFDMTDEQFHKSIKSFLFNGIKYKKFPAASDFLDSVGASPSKLATKGWVYMKKMLERHGRYVSVRFGRERRHLALHATIDDLGGWVEMCKKTYIEMDRLEDKFKETFIDIYTTRELKEGTILLGVYRSEPVDLSISSNAAIGYDKSSRKTQLEQLKEEQMKRLNLPEEKE